MGLFGDLFDFNGDGNLDSLEKWQMGKINDASPVAI